MTGFLGFGQSEVARLKGCWDPAGPKWTTPSPSCEWFCPRIKPERHKILEIQGLECTFTPTSHLVSWWTSWMPSLVIRRSHIDWVPTGGLNVLEVWALALTYVCLTCSVNLKPTHSCVGRLLPPIAFRRASGPALISDQTSSASLLRLVSSTKSSALGKWVSIHSCSVGTSWTFLASHFCSKTFLVSLGLINLFKIQLKFQLLQEVFLITPVFYPFWVTCNKTILNTMGYQQLV